MRLTDLYSEAVRWTAQPRGFAPQISFSCSQFHFSIVSIACFDQQSLNQLLNQSLTINQSINQNHSRSISQSFSRPLFIVGPGRINAPIIVLLKYTSLVFLLMTWSQLINTVAESIHQSIKVNYRWLCSTITLKFLAKVVVRLWVFLQENEFFFR